MNVADTPDSQYGDPHAFTPGAGNVLDQPHGVRVLWALENVLDGSRLDDVPFSDHHYTLSDRSHQRQIVGDE